MWFVWIGAAIIGLTLGLLGSGGSAITVPVLTYLVGHETKQSIAESMAIVGLISLVASIPFARSRQIDWHSVLYFGIPGMIGTLVGAWLGGIAAGVVQLLVFGGVLFVAAYMMLRQPKPVAPVDEPAVKAKEKNKADDAPEHQARSPIWKIALDGTIVGIVTGFVGVGGGFLIVPALVVFGKLPMRQAIGTSLAIIVLKSVVGFAKYQQQLLSHGNSVDFQTVAIFVVIGIVGSLIGSAINTKLNQRVLKRVFAIFLILLGGFVIVKESVELFNNANDSSSQSINILIPNTLPSSDFPQEMI